MYIVETAELTDREDRLNDNIIEEGNGMQGIIPRLQEQRSIYEEMQYWGRDILSSNNFIETQKNIQHGNVSVREHSIHVAIMSLKIVRKFNISCYMEDLIRGALLHDYFLYDWHIKDEINPHRLHGFYHPKRALMNAQKEFKLTNRQCDIIKKHMWPLTIVPPRYKEGWIVTMADKYCSLLETMHVRKNHVKFIVNRIFS